MSVSVVDPRIHPGGHGHPGGQASPAGRRSHPSRPRQVQPRHRRPFGIRVGQIVATEAALALVIASLGHGPLLLVGAALVAVALIVVAWLPLRHRWLFEWIRIGVRYLGRERQMAGTDGVRRMLTLAAPDAQLSAVELGGDDAAVIADANGLTALLELGDATELLADTPDTFPSPASLLPAAGPDLPPVRIQLVISGAPAPTLRAGAGVAGTSYRQLTDGRLLAQTRAVLAVRVCRADGWSEEDLLRALSSLVRKIRRRLGIRPARQLGVDAALRVLGELAHFDVAYPVRESWNMVTLGGLTQATFRMRRWPDLYSDAARQMIPRLLSLPAVATTVALSVGPRVNGTDAVAVDLTVRIAAGDPNGLATAAQALRRLLSSMNATVRRLDGEQMSGLAATLPLARGGPGPIPALSPTLVVPLKALEALDLTVAGSGLMIGTNRHGAPVTLRLFRAEPTRAVLIGGIRAAQLVVLRAMALGARVVLQTSRPRAWEPFVRGVTTPAETIAMIPPGRPIGGPPGTPLHPLLIVVDIGPVAADNRPAPGWHASLVVRDELTPTDVDAVSRADLLVLQPLRPEEASLAGAALGLGEAAGWLSRIRHDMIGVINRRAVRWALLTSTPLEAQLVGSPARTLATGPSAPPGMPVAHPAPPGRR